MIFLKDIANEDSPPFSNTKLLKGLDVDERFFALEELSQDVYNNLDIFHSTLTDESISPLATKINNDSDVIDVFDIYMDDIQNVSESIFPVHTSNEKTSVIVKNVAIEQIGVKNGSLEREFATFDEIEKNNDGICEWNLHDVTNSSDNRISDEKMSTRENLNIEKLVEECFHQERTNYGTDSHVEV